MPIFMDRHDVSTEVTAENVADLHQRDLKVQHKFNCKGLTYWFDDKRKTAFCLVEAPNKEAILEMHNHAHGAVPHQIITVDDAIVESFLGRIEDPKKSQNTALNIINDPAFKIIAVAQVQPPSFLTGYSKTKIDNWVNHISQFINQYKGRIVKQRTGYILASFDTVSDAVLCGVQIQSEFNQYGKSDRTSTLKLQMGISCGVPVTRKESIFEDSIQMAEWLAEFVLGQLVVATEVMQLFESENMSTSIDFKKINFLNLTDEKFLKLLIDFIESEWNNPVLNIENFSRSLGLSKSHLYRKMVKITGKSPNSFIKTYRLKKSLKLLRKKNMNISEIAFESGFNSPAYFSKCFKEAFGILPSDFTRHRI